jgi:ketosteroid isomerase-like protein
MTRWATLLILALAPAAFAAAQSDRTKRADVQRVFEHCIEALRALDGDRFSDCFADDITLFNPDIADAKSLHLLSGRAAVEAHFRTMFKTLQNNSRDARLDIAPRDELIQLAGDTAIVTFEFPRVDGGYGRRTMVLVRRAAGWKILHIHASNIPGSRVTP